MPGATLSPGSYGVLQFSASARKQPAQGSLHSPPSAKNHTRAGSQAFSWRQSVWYLSFRKNFKGWSALVRVEMLKIDSERPEPSLIRYAADQIRAGQVLGMPTDTFYGLAADPFNLRAVDRVYEIKTRSRHKPLSLLIEDVEQAEELARPLPEEFHALAKKFWPGPLTIIVKAASRLPLKVTANTGNVALRIPNAK